MKVEKDESIDVSAYRPTMKGIVELADVPLNPGTTIASAKADGETFIRHSKLLVKLWP